MTTNLERYKKDLDKLIEKGQRLQLGLIKELGMLDQLENKEELLKSIKPLNFNSNYEDWYTESLAIITQLLPSRLNDFIVLYKNEKRKDIDFLTYTISDHLLGLVTRKFGEIKADGKAAFPKFQQQFKILASLKNRFESSLFDIKQIVQADLFDSEIETSKELNKKGFHRAAGVIGGVVLEKHLSQVCDNHKILLRKKYPTISDFNDTLKEKEIIDVPTWRFIQRLGDIRNLCGHNKDKEPTKEDVEELLAGIDKIIKSIY